MRSSVFMTALPFAVCAGLVGGFFGPALLGDEQFAYRDAGHYYYPLHEHVQQFWKSGHWPLWDPGENAGVPLLANPTAAVLYPGQLIFAVLPYALASKCYIIGHVCLAFASVWMMMRAWQSSRSAALLSATAYAFGAPILFQTSNVIFLVGASWAPLGLLAAEQWISNRKRSGLCGFAIVLALQFLGGDPESAYLTGLCSLGYALLFDRRIAGADRKSSGLLIVSLFGLWIVATLGAGYFLPGTRSKSIDPSVASPYRWQPLVGPALMLMWFTTLVLVIRWAYKHRSELYVHRLVGLIVAGLLACLLTCAQLLPALEYGHSTSRSLGSASLEVFSFSLEPIRIIEFLWPQCFGSILERNHHWLSLIPSAGKRAKIWVPSLYLGGTTFLLALSQLQFRRGRRLVVWLSLIVLVSGVLSLGEYAGPLCWIRQFSIGSRLFGPHDPPQFAGPRLDGSVRDGEGSPYWLLSTILPGFGSFRYPSKLLTFTALGLSALAGFGWDSVVAGDKRTQRRLLRCAVVALAASVVVLIVAESFRGGLLARPSSLVDSSFGPLDQHAAFAEVRQALVQGAAMAIAMIVTAVTHRRPGPLRPALVLIISMADILVANRSLVVTVPQSILNERPEALRVIEAAERQHPQSGPYRVYRALSWEPGLWALKGSNQRVQEIVKWERDTLQPKHGLPEGVEATLVTGAAQFSDYAAFFEPHLETIADGSGESRDRVVHPRRAYDLWNTRYFILPYASRAGGDRSRGISSFLPRTELIYPPPGSFLGQEGRDRQIEWARNHDVQIRRNLDALPRAWVVHNLLPLPRPSAESTKEERLEPILFSESDRWRDPMRPIVDLRRTVWISPDDAAELAPYANSSRSAEEETVTNIQYEPNRVRLSARLAQPGLVVLADVFAPGWKLEIDGKPAPIYRVNGMMRGAAVRSGEHSLVFSYQPTSFRIGLALSGLGVLILIGFALLKGVGDKHLHGINP